MYTRVFEPTPKHKYVLACPILLAMGWSWYCTAEKAEKQKVRKVLRIFFDSHQVTSRNVCSYELLFFYFIYYLYL